MIPMRLENVSGWEMEQKGSARSVRRRSSTSEGFFIRQINRDSEIHERGLSVRT